MTDLEGLKEFYQGKRVLITGHTGFKGSWLSVILGLLGARVYGYALATPEPPQLFNIIYGRNAGCKSDTDLRPVVRAGIDTGECLVESHIGDIRDIEELESFYQRIEPEIVIHMAAQPIVRESYRIPRETYEINVMGTVNLLECVRNIPSCSSFLNVTTDKVYQNDDAGSRSFRETDLLDGRDPYSNSKSCSELVTHSYSSSFLRQQGVMVSTARAGNVIGGGDFAADRIVPDCVRAALSGQAVTVRNPESVRPYQHVLEPLLVYLTIAMKQAQDPAFAGYYNVGPDVSDCVTTAKLCDLFCGYFGAGLLWESAGEAVGPHEAALLRLDNTKIKEVFGWQPVWRIESAVAATVEWVKAYRDSEEFANETMLAQIGQYRRS